MKQVKVKTTDLLVALRENRTKHEAEFKAALIGYQEQAIELLKKRLAEFEAGDLEAQAYLHLAKPTNYLKEYDLAIKMLGMSVDSEVELTSLEFNQYVMDEWTWKQQFAASTSMYNNAKN